MEWIKNKQGNYLTNNILTVFALEEAWRATGASYFSAKMLWSGKLWRFQQSNGISKVHKGAQSPEPKSDYSRSLLQIERGQRFEIFWTQRSQLHWGSNSNKFLLHKRKFYSTNKYWSWMFTISRKFSWKWFHGKNSKVLEIKNMKKIFNLLLFQGCYEAVINKAVENQHVVIGVSVGILALQILGIIFSFCLCKAIGKDRDYHYKYWHRDNAASTHPNAASRRPSSGNKQQPQQG